MQPQEPEPRRGPAARRQALAVEWSRFAGLGIQFAATIGLFTWAGWWADSRLSSSPWCLLLGVALGFTGALIALVKAVPRASRRSPPR
ncbi:MAG: AtpZ/AtpI family protein [Planctomycetes bacterium]|nr:AtpZ/AtpI family protein [Planctomycetota bacterium]